MKILYITGAYPPMRCGVGDYTSQLVAGLVKIPNIVSGVLTSVAAADSSSRPYNFFPIIKRWGFAALPVINESLKQFRPDIIHLQYPSSFGRVFMPNFLPLICKARGIVSIQTWHEHPIYSQIINSLPTDTLVVVDPDYPGSYRQPYRFLVHHKECAHIPIGANIPRADTSPAQRILIRNSFDSQEKRLIAYFGFAGDKKGIELLFQAANPDRDRIVLLCDLNPDNSYQATILRLAESAEWRGKCFVTGYMPDRDAAAVLESADAAIFPFVEGSTPRNGSILAARLQGTFVITTHAWLRGYNASEHVFYVVPGDFYGIRDAIELRSGTRFSGVPSVTDWDDIAVQHFNLYEQILGNKK